MILITGMPRAGTSYLQDKFGELGEFMKPKVWGGKIRPKTIWDLAEPPLFSQDMLSMGITGKALTNLFETMELSYKCRRPDLEPCMKHLNLVHYPEELLYFSKVIVCIRDPKDWIESAKRFKPTQNMVKYRGEAFNKYNSEIEKAESELSGYAKVIQKISLDLLNYLHKKNKNPLLFNFDKPNFEVIFGAFNLKEEKINEIKQGWKGSRWNKNSKWSKEDNDFNWEEQDIL